VTLRHEPKTNLGLSFLFRMTSSSRSDFRSATTAAPYDATDFESGRIRELNRERLHIQQKTFTKWVNSFLQKSKLEVSVQWKSCKRHLIIH
jgi:hypothetical protein